jgi:hypothetical protein
VFFTLPDIFDPRHHRDKLVGPICFGALAIKLALIKCELGRATYGKLRFD